MLKESSPPVEDIPLFSEPPYDQPLQPGKIPKPNPTTINFPNPPVSPESLNGLTLSLPPGHLGVRFSNTIPCEIDRIDAESAIYGNTIRLLGRLAYCLSIPNRIEIRGALDRVTIESLLSTYSNIPNRRLIFVDRVLSFNSSGVMNGNLITTTVLPTGPVNATFHLSKRLIKSRNRIYVDCSPPDLTYQIPPGHFVDKVIVPGKIVLEGGVRSLDRLQKILTHFSNTEGRQLVFQRNLPRSGTLTRVTLPPGETGMLFYSKFDDRNDLPFVSTVLEGSNAWKLNICDDQIVESLEVPNEIKIERMGMPILEQVLSDYEGANERILTLRDSRHDLPRTGPSVTITLPTGTLGVVFKSSGKAVWLSQVKEGSPIQKKCPVGYFVSSFCVPGETELVGIEELKSATFLSTKIKESNGVKGRVLVLKLRKQDVEKRETKVGMIGREFV